MKKLLCLLIVGLGLQAFAADKKIVFIAGKPSHRSGEHEHRAGCLLLQSCLTNVPGIATQVFTNGWPTDAAALKDAATIVLYSDGAGGHPFLADDRLKTVGELMKRGVGLVLIHFAVEPTKEKGQAEFLDWIGGAFEINWSVNPHWLGDFTKLPSHPVTRGVKPFQIDDEWYFNMRFRDQMRGVTSVLSAVPPLSTIERADGPHENNATVRGLVQRGALQHVAWAAERPDGGRGFGFTGGHFHRNWGNDDFRKLVLNAIVWTAKVEVPSNGVQSSVSAAQLGANLDDKRDRRPQP